MGRLIITASEEVEGHFIQMFLPKYCAVCMEELSYLNIVNQNVTL